MSKTFLISDTHFGHGNILTFYNSDGSKVRDFNDLDEMNEIMIQNWNNVVSDEDKVYHLGDVVFTKKWLDLILPRLNGTKILIKGNHDNLKLSQYQQYFKDVRAYWVLDKFILSHIPIHPESLSRWKANIHGHLHTNALNDPRYFNVSVEQINYTPINFEEIKALYDTQL
jgi:calcineurin-like phosphoesterase family protein